jgi:hypothetical protein
MQQMKARGILHTHTLGIIYVLQVIMVLYIYTAFSILLILYSRFAKPHVIMKIRLTLPMVKWKGG